MYGLNKFFVQIVDLKGRPITTGLKVTIRTSAGLIATVYSSAEKAALTNPITTTAFAALTKGIVTWWSGATTFDLEVCDTKGNKTMVYDWTNKKNEIVFDAENQPAAELVGANITAGAELVDTAATFVDFPNAVTIPAGMLNAGDVIRIRGEVRIADFNAGDTIDLKLLIGTESIFTTGDLTPAADGDLVHFDFDVTVDVVGASGKLSGFGYFLSILNATKAITPKYMAQATEDLTGDLVVKVQGDYSAAHADNEAYLQHLIVEVLHRRAA